MTTAVRRTALTTAEVYALPAMPTLVPQAAAAVGVSRDTAYELASRDQFVVPVIKIGRSLKVRRADLLAFLGLPQEGEGENL